MKSFRSAKDDRSIRGGWHYHSEDSAERLSRLESSVDGKETIERMLETEDERNVNYINI